jgi:hypothetical protein
VTYHYEYACLLLLLCQYTRHKPDSKLVSIGRAPNDQKSMDRVLMRNIKNSENVERFGTDG